MSEPGTPSAQNRDTAATSSTPSGPAQRRVAMGSPCRCTVIGAVCRPGASRAAWRARRTRTPLDIATSLGGSSLASGLGSRWKDGGIVLILAATPIGNLGDATRRLVAALEAAPVVAAEDTRVAQRLLAALGIANRPRLIAVNEHTERDRIAELLTLAAEQDVVL